MRVEIEAGDVQAALGTAVQEGMAEAAGGRKVKQAVQEATAQAIQAAGLVERIQAAVVAEVTAQVDPLCEEVARSVVPCLREALRETAFRCAADIIMAVSRRAGYLSSEDEKTLRAETETRLRERLAGSAPAEGEKC